MKGSKRWFVLGLVLLVALGVVVYFVIRQRGIVSYDPAEFFFAPGKGEAVLYANLPNYDVLVNAADKGGWLDAFAESGKVDKEFVKKSAKYISRLAYISYYLPNGNKERFLFITPKLSMDMKSIKKVLLLFDPSVKMDRLPKPVQGRDVYKIEFKKGNVVWSFYAKGSLVVSKSEDAIRWLLKRKSTAGKALAGYLPHKVKGKWYVYVDVNKTILEGLMKKGRKYTGKVPIGGIEVAINRKESGMVVVDAFIRARDVKKESIVDTSKNMLFVTKLPMLKNIVFMLGANIKGDIFIEKVKESMAFFPKLRGEDPFKLIGTTKEEMVKLFDGGLLAVVGGEIKVFGREYPAFLLYLAPKDSRVLVKSAKWISNLLSSNGVIMKEVKVEGWKKLFTGSDVVPVFVGVRRNYIAFGVGKLNLLSSDVLAPRQIKNISKEAKGVLLFLDIKRIKELVKRFASGTKIYKGVNEFFQKLPRISYLVIFLKDYNMVELRIIP